jgi:alpha-glucosidase
MVSFGGKIFTDPTISFKFFSGITEKLPYLKEIGIKGTWLSPIYKSPNVDLGYDISDFRDIQPEFGTMAEFEVMTAKAHELGIKIIMDFVPNHSSDQHEWFNKSVNSVDGFENFYVWHPGYPDPNNATGRLVPSNWASVFGGSAWEWNDKRQAFYYHQFYVQQPDLNFREPKVQDAMKVIIF